MHTNLFNPPKNSTLRNKISNARCCIFLGSGGTGKTTLSAACAAAMARQGKKVLLLTVDPSRRLDTLASSLSDTNLTYRRLDVQASVRRYMVTVLGKEGAERLIHSRFFPYLTELLPDMFDYAAAGQILSDLKSGRYELIVVDTPPLGYARRFLGTPETLASFAKYMKMLSSISTAANRGLLSIPGWTIRGLATFLGSEFLKELFNFIALFAPLWDHLEKDSRELQNLFHNSTLYLFIATLDDRACDEVANFFGSYADDFLSRQNLVLVFNQVFCMENHNLLRTAEAAEILDMFDKIGTLNLWPPAALSHCAKRISFASKIGLALIENQRMQLSILSRKLPCNIQVCMVPLVVKGIGRGPDLVLFGSRFVEQQVTAGLQYGLVEQLVSNRADFRFPTIESYEV